MRAVSIMARTAAALALGAGGALSLAACTSAKIAALESMGYAKREQLVSRVEDARDGQEAAKKQFQSALEEFLAVTGAGSDARVADLEARYSRLKREYERSESRADAVRDRITSVERVADALFKEWSAELGQYSSESLRRASERQLEDTKAQYGRLIGVMRLAAGKMDPALAALRDQTLFLKHNLNARAIAGLQQTASQVTSDVGALVREMEAAIAEADAFLSAMREEPTG